MRHLTKYLMVASAIMCLSLMVSCEKEGTARFKGNYSFKTSGSITVVRDAAYVNDTTYRINGLQIDTVITPHPEEMTLSINNESGQMDITPMGDGKVAVSMNVIGGSMVLYYATAEGKELALDETTRHLTLASFSMSENDNEFGARPIAADLVISGSAQRFDNIVLFDLAYEGDFWANDRLYHIVDSDIVCRAKLNE